jgi:DNA-binding Lrp family transcriptional regulator
MSFEYLIPSMVEYASKFRQLDSLDFKIIKAMYVHGVFNISKIAEIVGVPQQTASYRVNRLSRQDTVRFRALLNEQKLGLKSYAVFAETSLGEEEASSCAMTCFPLWRHLSILDGRKHGNYVRYVIPPDKKRDLTAFLNELKNMAFIGNFDIVPTASPAYPLLNLDFYKGSRQDRVFDWRKWVDNIDSFPEVDLTESTSYDKVEFDICDLIILRCYEINARSAQRNIVKEMMKITKEKSHQKLVSLVSRRINERIVPQNLITGYRAYLLPNPSSISLYFLFSLHFSNSSDLKKFAGGLCQLPYHTCYEKILSKDTMFLKLVIPAYETANVQKTIADLAEKGYIKNCNLFIGDLAGAAWNNVEIYKMFKDGAWNFSYGAAINMLENIT